MSGTSGTIPAKGYDRPALKLLNKYVRKDVSFKWHDLGLELLEQDDEKTLNEIEANNPTDVSKCCKEMFQLWLRKCTNATWNQLIQALKEIELSSLAAKIEGMLIPTEDTVSTSAGLQSGNNQQLDTAKNPQLQIVLDDYVDHPDFYTEKFKDDDVVCAFTFLLQLLNSLFDKVDFRELKSAFMQRCTLLSNEYKEQIKASDKVDDLLDALDKNRMYCNWLNTRVLKRIVKTINIQKAEHLIQTYENCVYSRKVSDVMVHFNSSCFNPSHVAKVNTKIVKFSEDLTVADIIKYCEKLECDMGVDAGSVTATECQPGCLQITCVIPIHCALHAYETAKTNFLRFRQFHIQYIEIESFPKVFALNFNNQEKYNLDKITSGALVSSNSSQVLSHYYTLLENYMDADSVSHMMHCEHLITNEDYEVINVAPNDNKMNTLLLQYVRSMNMSQLSRFCDILKSIESHKIIWDCSSTGLLLKFSTNVRVSVSKPSMVSSIEHMKLSDVNIVFYDLIDHLYLCLTATEKCSFNFSDINPLFTKQWLKKLKSLHLFKMYLLLFITWFDHSILKELVVASCNEDAQQLLNLFDSKINFYSTQPIKSFPILSPNQLMIPLDNSEYTLLAMKFLPSSQSDTTEGMITLKDVIDIKKTVEHKWKISSHNIQLVAVHTELEYLYWMIPKHLVEVIEGNLIHSWKSRIIMLAVLPVNFYSLEDNCERLKGPLSPLNFLWQDDTEVLSATSVRNKLVNIDTQNLLQQYVQLYNSSKEEKTPQTVQLRYEISEMTSHIAVLEMENTNLKEYNKKLEKHYRKRIEEKSPLLIEEEKTPQTVQLRRDISEMTSRIAVLEMENAKLKEYDKKMEKHYGQKKEEKSPLLIEEEKTPQTVQLRHDISEMTSRIAVLEMENAKLKEYNQKLEKHYEQKKEKSHLH